MFFSGYSPTLKCLERGDMSVSEKEYQTKITRLYDISREVNQQFFRRELEFGREFIHPDDENKIIRIHHFNKQRDETFMMSAADRLEILNSNDEQLNGNPRISQKIYRMFCEAIGDDYVYAVELERFRGGMMDSVGKDQALTAYVLNFGNRLQLYNNLAITLQYYYNIGYKHCALDITRILYKRRDDDFSKNDGLNNDSQFDFVMGDLGYMVPIDTPCSKGQKDSQDHDDALKEIPSTDKCKRKIEVFGLGMVFLELEVFANTVNGDQAIDNREDDVVEGYADLNDAPKDLKLFLARKDPLNEFNLLDLLSKLRSMIVKWNKNQAIGKGVEMTFNSLNKDLGYITKANTVVFESYNNFLCPELANNLKAKKKIDDAYKTFNTMMLKMMEENDFVNGRPNQQEISNKLVEILTGYRAGVAMISRQRRILI